MTFNTWYDLIGAEIHRRNLDDEIDGYSADNHYDYMAIVFNGFTDEYFLICKETIPEVVKFLNVEEYNTHMPEEKGVDTTITTEWHGSALCSDPIDVYRLDVKTYDPNKYVKSYQDSYDCDDMKYIMAYLEMGPNDVLSFINTMKNECMIKSY